MICNTNTKNGEKVKLLAVIAALVMVVCAVAVVLPSEDIVADPQIPEESPFGDVENATYADGVYTVTGAAEFDVSKDGVSLGTAAQPLDIQFDIQNGGSVSFVNNGTEQKTVYINHVAPVNTTDNTYTYKDKSVFYGTSTTSFGSVTVGQNVVLDLAVSIASGATASVSESIHILTYVDLTLAAETAAEGQTAAVPGGQVIMSQAESVNGVSWYYGNLNANAGSVITLDGSNGISNVKFTMNNATMNIVNPNKMAINPAADSKITNSTITSDSTVGNHGYLNVAQNITITNSTVDLGAANLLMTEGYKITAAGTTISTDGEFQYLDGQNEEDVAEISGATLNGTFTSRYTLTDVTFGDVQASEDAELTIAGTSKGTVESAGTIIIDDDANVSALTVRGGTLQAAENMPNCNGTTVNYNGVNYLTYTLTQNGFKVNLGITPGIYGAVEDYAGYKGAGVRILSITYPNTTESVGDVDQSIMTNLTAIVYANEEEAENPPAELTPVIDVGDNYVIKVTALLNIPQGPNMNIDEEVFTFKVLPATVDNIEIIGQGEAGAIEDQYFDKNATGVDLVPGTDLEAAGVDYIVQITTVDGQTIVLDPSEYTAAYTYENGEYGAGDATLTVTLRNYALADGTNTATADFEILKSLDHLNVTANKDSYYVGMAVSADDFTVTGVYTDESEDASLDLSSLKILVGDATEPQDYYDQAGTDVTLTFQIMQGDVPITGTVTIDIIGIESITVENISEDDKYTVDYNVNDKFDTNGMKVTVNYENGDTAVLQDATESPTPEMGFVQDTTTEGLVTETLSTNVVIDPSVLSIYGEGQTIYVDYFGARAEITVNVTLGEDQYGIIYMNGDEQLTIQTGEIGEYAAIYNYVWGTDTGFVGWEVEDYGVVYLAGTVVKFGENTAMWGDDSVLYLYATFGGQTTPGGDDEQPATASENILVSVSPTEAGFDVYLIGLDGGYIPADITITGTYYFTYQTQSGATSTIGVDFEITEIVQVNGQNIAMGTFEIPSEVLDSVVYVEASFGGFDSARIVY